MFLYRGLLLAVTISSTSIVLADILFQPGYEHRYNTDPQYRAFIRDTTSQQQFHNAYGVPSSNLQLASYPHHYYHRPYYHHYQYPSSAYYHQQAPQHYYTVTAHHRHKRSPEADPTNAESSEATVASRDAISAISTLDGPLTTTLMPPRKKRTMDVTDDKRVEDPPNKDDHPFRVTGLFGLNPENMRFKHRHQLESQQSKSNDEQDPSPKSLPVSSSEDNDKLRQKKHHNQAGFHSTSLESADVTQKSTVKTTKYCFDTQGKSNVMFSFAVPSHDGPFYTLSPVNAIQQTADDDKLDDSSNANLNDNEIETPTDNEVKQTQDRTYSLDSFSNQRNNVLYYVNRGTPSYLIPETYKSLNFQPVQGVSAYYYPVSRRNIAPQRYTPSYGIPLAYTSPYFPSVRGVSTYYNYNPVGPRYIAPQTTYYSTYPSTCNNVP